MADNNTRVRAKGDTEPLMISNRGLALIVYILYLAGFLTGVSAVVGLIIAMIEIDRSDAVSRSHFRFQIRTFWIGLIYVVAGIATLHVGVGALIMVWWIVWTAMRCVKGLLALNAGEPIADPESFLFG
jgi:uncharacterized membrane protein